MATSTSTASTQWKGSLMEGSGETALETSGLTTFDLTWGKRTGPGPDNTNPEELIAAAYASCYSMQLSHGLSEDGFVPEAINTRVSVDFNPEQGGITGIKLSVHGIVPNMAFEDFKKKAEWAKDTCPVGKALSAVKRQLEVVDS